MATVGEGNLGMVPAHHRAGEEGLARLGLSLIAGGPRTSPDVHDRLLRLAEHQRMAGLCRCILNVQCNTYECCELMLLIQSDDQGH